MVDQQAVAPNEKLIERARSIWAGDELEIDDGATVSKTGDETGHWVQAWVYVRDQADPDEVPGQDLEDSPLAAKPPQPCGM
jgi:hypothetical protein